MSKKKLYTILLFLLIFLTSCLKNSALYIAPEVDDLTDIVARDTLRVATMYSSTSYFMYRDELMGFDYEMAKNLADYLNLHLKVSIANNRTELLHMLQSGEVDIITYNLAESRELKSKLSFVFPQTPSYQVLVQNMGLKVISSVTELSNKTIHVVENTIFQKRLTALNDEIGGNINIILHPDSLTSEDLIDSVGERKFEYTVAFHNVAQLHKTYYRNLDCRLPISFKQSNGWLVCASNKDLKEIIERWENMPETQTEQERVRIKYWENSPYFSLRRIKIPKGDISPFDRFFKQYAPLINWDWQMLASIAYHESKFNPKQRSWAGALGLMQLMPRTAANFGLNSHSVLDPELNIEAAVQYIKSLNLTFRKIENKDERIKFILAAYNSGPAHVIDAMALAKKYGKNPYIWFENVESFLLKKNDPKYYQDEVVKYGYFQGKVTVNYVRNALATHSKYCRRKELSK